MIVTCEQCKARFRLPDDKVGASGAKVRCSKCQHTFVVHRDEDLALADIDDVMLVDESSAARLAAPASGPEKIVGIGEWKPGMPAGKPPRPDDDSAPMPVFDSSSAPPTRPKSGSLIELGGIKKANVDFHEQETGLQDIAKLTVRQREDADEVLGGPAFTAAVHEARTRVIKLPKDEDFARARQEAEAGKRMTEPNLDSAIVDPSVDFEDDDPTDEHQVAGDGLSIAGADPFASAQPASIADIDPFGATDPGSKLADELFSDLPAAEESGAEPFDPFESAGAVIGGRKATRQMGDIAADVDIGGKRDEPRSGLGTVINGLAASVGVGALAVGLTFFFAGDRLLALARRSGPAARLPTLEGVRLLSTRSVRYPTRAGEEVIVVSGEAENSSAKDRDDLYVVAEIRDGGGKVLGNNRAPLGLALTPPELTELRDDATVTAAFAGRAAATRVRGIAAGATAPYTVVILRPPITPNGLVPLLKLVKGEPIVVPEPEPAAPQPEEVTADDEPRRKGKGKKRKGKKRKGKKRKKKGEEE